jgi:hypothetical protein
MIHTHREQARTGKVDFTPWDRETLVYDDQVHEPGARPSTRPEVAPAVGRASRVGRKGQRTLGLTRRISASPSRVPNTAATTRDGSVEAHPGRHCNRSGVLRSRPASQR